MELYIQIRDGQPFEHPIMGDNLRQLYPDLDPNNLPAGFAKFTRVPAPPVQVYEINDGVTYEFQDGVVTDVWHVRDMTAEERVEKQERIKAAWAALDHKFASWQFDEATCAYQPPVPYPTDGAIYTWDEDNVTWQLLPPPPAPAPEPTPE